MSRRLVVPLAAGLVLGAAAPAGAKEVQQALACGANGCRDITAQVGHDESVLQTGGFVDGPSRRAPFYRIRLTVGEGDDAHATWHVLYVPSQRIVGSVDDSTGHRVWSQAPRGASRLHRATRGLRPLPARRLPMPTNDERRVRGALPPEVVPPPARAVPAAPTDGGVDWALVVPVLGLGSAGMAFGARAMRRRRRR